MVRISCTITIPRTFERTSTFDPAEKHKSHRMPMPMARHVLRTKPKESLSCRLPQRRQLTLAEVPGMPNKKNTRWNAAMSKHEPGWKCVTSLLCSLDILHGGTDPGHGNRARNSGMLASPAPCTSQNGRTHQAWMVIHLRWSPI